MPPTDPSYESLREIATKATPGEWLVYIPPEAIRRDEDGEGYIQEGWRGIQAPDSVSFTVAGTSSGLSAADALHIAAFDPPTVLRLLDALERAEAAVERLRGDVHYARGRTRQILADFEGDGHFLPAQKTWPTGASGPLAVAAYEALAERSRALVFMLRAMLMRLPERDDAGQIRIRLDTTSEGEA